MDLDVHYNLKLKLKLKLEGLAKFGGWRILILRLLRTAAAGSLGTYTYPLYVGVTVPIGTTIGGDALLLEIVLRKKSQSGIVYKVYTCAARERRREKPRARARPSLETQENLIYVALKALEIE